MLAGAWRAMEHVQNMSVYVSVTLWGVTSPVASPAEPVLSLSVPLPLPLRAWDEAALAALSCLALALHCCVPSLSLPLQLRSLGCSLHEHRKAGHVEPPIFTGWDWRQARPSAEGRLSRASMAVRVAQGPGSLRCDSPLPLIVSCPARQESGLHLGICVPHLDHQRVQLPNHSYLHHTYAQLKEHLHAAGRGRSWPHIGLPCGDPGLLQESSLLGLATAA